MSRHEFIGKGRVLGIPIERHDPRIDSTELDQGGAVSGAGRDLFTQLIARCRKIGRHWSNSKSNSYMASRTGANPKRRAGNTQGLTSAIQRQLLQRLFQFFPFLQRFPVPAVAVFQERDPFALEGPGHNHSRPLFHALRFI